MNTSTGTLWAVSATVYRADGSTLTLAVERILAPSRYAAVNAYSALFPTFEGERSRATRSVPLAGGFTL